MTQYAISLTDGKLPSGKLAAKGWQVSEPNHRLSELHYSWTREEVSLELERLVQGIKAGDQVLVDSRHLEDVQRIALQCLERGARAYLGVLIRPWNENQQWQIKNIIEMPLSVWFYDRFQEIVQTSRLPQVTGEIQSKGELASNTKVLDDQSTEPVSAPNEADRPPEDLVEELLKISSWDESALLRSQIEALQQTLALHGEEWAEKGRQACASGKTVAKAIREIEKFFRENLLRSFSSEGIQKGLKDINQRYQDNPQVARFLNFYLKKKAEKELVRLQSSAVREKSSYVERQVEHRIFKLAPAGHWVVYVDETGDDYDEQKSGKKLTGRVVAVLVPQSIRERLPALPKKWHSSKQTTAEVDEAMQQLLDLPVGILGLSKNALKELRGDRYTAMVNELMATVLRFLPLDGPTVVEVLMENRGLAIEPVHWEPVRAELLRQLKDQDPNRASQIDLKMNVLKKDADPRLGYADVVAFTWGSSRAVSQERLKISGLKKFCLSDATISLLRTIWDRLGEGRQVEPEYWRKLVAIPDATQPNSLAGYLFLRLQGACRENPEAWARYAEETTRHLESKAVNLSALYRELAWLRACVPRLPLKLELAFLVSELALSNHTGHVFSEAHERIRELAEQLFEEDARLCCYADLHLAVSCTNRLAFQEARWVMAPWAKASPAVPGLQMWGRVLSTLGQIEAFEGRPHTALAHFDKAIEAFSRLSDEAIAQGEIRHTGTYRALALMDDPLAQPEELLSAVTSITGALPESIVPLATSGVDADKYAHHLLLRFLALHPAGATWREAYLQVKDHWATGEGHPWELIEYYRGRLLFNNPESAKPHLERCLEIASEGNAGPILNWIGLVLSETTVFAPYDFERTLELRERLAQNPLFGERMMQLDLCEKWEDAKLFQRHLPFNFH